MKLISIFVTSLFYIIAHADDRLILCEALDKLDREYFFEMNIDSGYIKVMPSGGVWKT